MVADIEFPIFFGRADFLPRLRPLWEEAYRGGADKWLSDNEKLVESGEPAGGHDGYLMGGHELDSGAADACRCAGEAGRLAQKRRLARVGFDELDPGGADDRQNETGKPGAAAEIDEALRPRGDQRQELRRIEKMAAPEIAERARGDKVDAAGPLAEQLGIGLEPRQCFT